MRALIPLSFAGLMTLGCTGLLDEALFDEANDCAHEVAVEPALSTSEVADFDLVVDVDLPEQLQPWEDGGKHRLQVWDCLDVSWWSSAEPRKVVQIYIDETECELYEAVSLEYYDCYSHESPDSPWRDYDGDGLTAFDGDPDDEDPSVPGEQGTSGDSGP